MPWRVSVRVRPAPNAHVLRGPATLLLRVSGGLPLGDSHGLGYDLDLGGALGWEFAKLVGAG
jgi:hypothetical protein